jgi:hypothetical protein
VAAALIRTSSIHVWQPGGDSFGSGVDLQHGGHEGIDLVWAVRVGLRDLHATFEMRRRSAMVQLPVGDRIQELLHGTHARACRTDTSYDDYAAEFFATLKPEIGTRIWANRHQTRQAASNSSMLRHRMSHEARTAHHRTIKPLQRENPVSAPEVEAHTLTAPSFHAQHIGCQPVSGLLGVRLA